VIDVTSKKIARAQSRWVSESKQPDDQLSYNRKTVDWTYRLDWTPEPVKSSWTDEVHPINEAAHGTASGQIIANAVREVTE